MRSAVTARRMLYLDFAEPEAAVACKNGISDSRSPYIHFIKHFSAVALETAVYVVQLDSSENDVVEL